MLKKVLMVVSIVLALMCAACVGVCVFNLFTAGNPIDLPIGLIAAFSLFTCGFLHFAFLAHAEIVVELYEEAEADEEDEDSIEIIFTPEKQTEGAKRRFPSGVFLDVLRLKKSVDNIILL